DRVRAYMNDNVAGHRGAGNGAGRRASPASASVASASPASALAASLAPLSSAPANGGDAQAAQSAPAGPGSGQAAGGDGTHFRFYDNRQKYLMFVNTCGEKWRVAERVGMELQHIRPTPPALRVFDAGMGDGSVLTNVMRQ